MPSAWPSINCAGGARIRAVGLATMAATLLDIDASGQPTTPVYTYADSRDPRAVATGTPLHPAYWPVRLTWLRRERPEEWARTRTWVSFCDYLLRQFGIVAAPQTSRSLASWTGLLDRQTGQWHAPLLAALNVDPARLPRIQPMGELVGTLAGPWRERWPALAEAPWYLPLGDGGATNLGCGALDADQLCVTVGTSGAVRLLLPAQPAQLPGGLWSYWATDRQALLGGSLTEGGGAVRWLMELLHATGRRGSDSLLTAPPDSHGLTVLPLFAGERSPGWSLGRRGVIVGLTLATRPSELVQALVEAITYRLTRIAARLAETARPRRAIATGRALLLSGRWLQLLADSLNLPVQPSLEPEAAARGVALALLQNLGLIQHPAERPAALGEPYLPDPGRHALYQRAAERQQRLYDRLTDWAGG